MSSEDAQRMSGQTSLMPGQTAPSPLLLPPDSDTPAPMESEEADDLMLRWDDHHKSFFELAEDLCHQEQFIDVTISCGEHNFPAHKLILSVCSPYFKNLFLRNPCKHPIIVLKDVPFKYMKLLLIFMYRGEVAVPQEDLSGLLKTARSLQVRGLSEMQSTVPAVISPRKRYLSDIIQDSDLESRDGEGFSLDEVKTRLCGQLEIQAVRGGGRGSPSSAGSVGTPPLHSWFSERVKYLPATSSIQHMDEVSTGLRSSRSESGPSEDEPSSQIKREPELSTSDNCSDDPRDFRDLSKKYSEKTRDLGPDSLVADNNVLLSKEFEPKQSPKRDFEGAIVDRKPPQTTATSSQSSSLLDAARAAGLDIKPGLNSGSDPMSSISALLAAAQATGGHMPMPASSGPRSAEASVPKPTSSTVSSASKAGPSASQQGLDLSNPQGAMAANVNAQMQLYYYMQKLQTAGMGNPKERKECPICGKTLYDRSTWNRHMRIHTGEKPYPCRFCGRRFRTNYNKLGHEKKCPDRHSASAILQPSPVQAVAPDSPSVVPNVVYR